MIAITEHAEGCVLPVRAQPGAKRSGVQGERNGALKVAVTAPPAQLTGTPSRRANSAAIVMPWRDSGVPKAGAPVCMEMVPMKVPMAQGAPGR